MTKLNIELLTENEKRERKEVEEGRKLEEE